jgi:hypothetical protein
MLPETKGRRHGCVIAFEGVRRPVSARAALRTNEFVPMPGRFGGRKPSEAPRL